MHEYFYLCMGIFKINIYMNYYFIRITLQAKEGQY